MTDMDVVFHCEEFAALPKILCHKCEDSEMTRRAAMTIDEILVANLGDSYVEPHLLVFPLPCRLNCQVRTELNDVIIYKPFQYTVPGASQTTLRFTKIFNPHLTREPFDHPREEEDISVSPTRMVALPSVSGYSAVFLCGIYPGFIMKTAHSTARFHRIVGESVRSVCQFNVIDGVQDGFLYYDSTVRSPLSGPSKC
jgi:cleavage and polyadenylation specificity factor subunit 1